MAGHIRLGAIGALREYIVDDPRNVERQQANPFTAAISTGGAYDNLEGWGQFLADDWQTGIGHQDPEEGLLFSSLETRVPRQVILPPLIDQTDTRVVAGSVDDCRNVNNHITASLLIGPNQTDKKIAIKLTPVSAYNCTDPWIAFALHCLIPATVTSPVIIRLKAGGNPAIATLKASSTMGSSHSAPSYQWHWGNFPGDSATTLAAGTYWIEIEPVEADIRIACTAEYTGAVTQTWNGTAWSNATAHPAFTTNWYALTPYQWAGISGPMASFNGAIYGASGRRLVKYNGTTWAYVGAALASDITSLVSSPTTLYIGVGSGNFQKCSTTDVITDGGSVGNFLTSYDGRIWKVINATGAVSYSNDGVAWTLAVTAPPVFDPLIALPIVLCGMGDNMYIATVEALYYAAPGDFLKTVTRWGSVRASNILQMVNHQGSIYATADGMVYRIDPSHSVIPVFANRDDETVANVVGTPVALCSLNNWLIVAVQHGVRWRSTLWVFTSQGWHYLAPSLFSYIKHLYFDHASDRLFASADWGQWFTVSVSDASINPYNDPNTKYACDGWMEFGKFYAGNIRLSKDFESVYVDIENASSDRWVEVWWMDEGSTAWEQLGTLTASGELRWSSYNTRPNSRWLRLGLRMRTRYYTGTPRLRALSLQYHPMVNDRYRWPVNVLVSDNQQFPDGTKNPYTQAQMITHLDGLIKQVPPFLFQDVDGVQYEVKVISHGRRRLEQEELPGGTKVGGYLYSLMLQQVNDTAYTA